MELYEAIKTRKSVRAYTDQDVPDQLITKLLEAARIAPSASNRQEWRFVVVKNANTRAKLCEAANGQKSVAQAPVVIACCAETNNHIMACRQACYPIDVAIAIDHITLCATAEGLGTCWIGAFDEDKAKAALNIPPHIRVVELLPLGYPEDASPIDKKRLALDEIVRYEMWE